MKASRRAIVLFLLLAALQCTYFYPRLPDQVASHFDGAGQADGWSSKPAFFATNLGITLTMAAMFLSIAWIMKKVPDSAINVPNRAYWLAAERRGATIDYVRSQMESLGAATIGFMVGLFQLSIEANLGATGGMPSTGMWLLFGGYGAFFVVWIVRFIGRWTWGAQ